MRAVLFAVAILAVLALAQPEEKPAPFVVLTKSVSSKIIVVGEKIDVTVTIFNYGQAPIFDVQITDKVTGGEAQTKAVEQLGFLENATFTYSVVPTEVGNFAVPNAEATFALVAGEVANHRAVSNTVREEDLAFRGEEFDDMSGRGVVYVVTRETYDRIHTKYVKESIAYLFLGAITVVFPFFMYRTKQNQVDYLIRQSKKK